MTPLKVINRLLISAAILVLTPLFFPTNVYAQECSRWEGFKRIVIPCPKPSPDPSPDEYIPPPPEDSRLTEAREQNELGMKAWNSRNWGLAAQHFEQALAKDPNSTLYRDNLNNARRQVEIDANRREQESLRAQRQKLKAGRDQGGFKPIGGSDSFGVKLSRPGSSDLIPLGNRETRNFGKGNQAVWKQLNCAVDLMGQALSKANPDNGENPSFAESRNLLGEALNALNGDPKGTRCSMGRPLPNVEGRTPDLSRAVTKERDLIERAKIAVDKLEQDSRPMTEEQRIAIAHAQSKKNQQAIAQRDAAALKQPRQKRAPHRIVVPTPTSPPKPEAKPKTALDKISAEAQEILVSFHLKRRRSPSPSPRPSPR